MLELTNINKSFGKGDAMVHVLKDASISISNNEMVAIMGKSGCGKSTILNIMACLCSFDSGTYKLKGQTIDFSKQKNLLELRRNTIGIVLQNFALLDDITVHENIAISLSYRKLTKKEINKQVDEMLYLLEIDDKKKAYPPQLSGGQQQRVAIARAMIKKPEILIADEPTGSLDEQTENDILKIFKKIHSSGKTIIIATHDKNVAECCDRTVVLKNGNFHTDSLSEPLS